MACFPRIISVSVLFLLLAQLGAGLGSCRTTTLAFKDGRNPALRISCAVYTERVHQELDLVISEARKNGICLILCLRPQYVRWPTNLDGDAFYTNPVVNRNFKKQVKRVLTRTNTVTGVAYRDDPAIMGWELISLQPLGQVDPHFGNLILSGWIYDMASFVKSTDGNHLLTVGVEHYFYGDSNMVQKKAINPGYKVGTDFIWNLLFIKEIDFITTHAYADVRLISWESDSKRMYGGGQNFAHFPNMHPVIQRRFLHQEEWPAPPSLVVVSNVKAAVPPSEPSGCTKIPTHGDGHCPNE